VCETVYDPTNNPASCADSDSDGIFDGVDNCPTTANANQANNDGDSQGDLCDTDDDNDGVLDGPDNCDFISNSSQADWNSNGVGDACEDSDGDGWTDSADNCKSLANPSQSNTDGDSYGNLCDNCPLVSNSTQADIDGDFLGDHCDNSDSDLGTWYDNAEIYLLTNRTVKCPATTTTNDEAVDPWPPDMNDNRLINGQDILVYNYVFGKLVTATPVPVPGMGSPDIHRFDLSYKTIQPGSGVINGQDILQYNSIFGSTCTP
jgi:hypothetical protein